MMSLHLSILQHINLLQQLLVHALCERSTYQSFPLVFIPSLDGHPCSAAGSHPPEPPVTGLDLLAESNSMGTSPAPCKAFFVRCCGAGFSV